MKRGMVFVGAVVALTLLVGSAQAVPPGPVPPTDTTSLSARVAALEAAVSALQTQVASQDGLIISLQTQVTSLQGQVSAHTL